ncbi:unnamed protein product [Blepharisma stoltei]|uniref:Uncharacterized protein n=1 Tax=Blepharisma stoltei TaxID=1481888 RepID=A0AAU9J351_9CILI|nr:unnamed protein product [Blepharisma stoltei]
MSIKSRLGERLRSFHLSIPVAIEISHKPYTNPEDTKTHTSRPLPLRLPAIKTTRTSSKLLEVVSPTDSNLSSPSPDYLLSPRYNKRSSYLPYIYAQLGQNMPRSYESGLFDDVAKTYMPRKESSINLLSEMGHRGDRKKTVA